MASKDKSDNMLLLGVLVGAAIGAAVALAYAPDKGEQNRKHLAEWANARVGEARDKAQSALPGNKSGPTTGAA